MGQSGTSVSKKYSGRATALLDDKSRLTIPRKFRKIMLPDNEPSATVWLIPGDGECDFKIMDKETGDRWADALSKASIPGAGSSVVRELLAIAEQVEIDKAGRVLLTREFIEDCDLEGERELGMAAKGDCLEVYGAERWKAYRERLSKRENRENAWKLLRDPELLKSAQVQDG